MTGEGVGVFRNRKVAGVREWPGSDSTDVG